MVMVFGIPRVLFCFKLSYNLASCPLCLSLNTNIDELLPATPGITTQTGRKVSICMMLHFYCGKKNI